MESVDFEERYYLIEESQLFLRSEHATLFKAFDAQEQYEVFIKICLPESFDLFKEQTLQELVHIRHKHLISLLNFFHLNPPSNSNYTNSLRVMVMNYVAGQPLSTLMFPLAESIVEIIEKQLLDVLNYLHQQGWVHRDVKPENVLIQDTDHNLIITLCDLEQVQRINCQPDSLVGTPEYMAPSVANWQPLQATSDFWSLGCLLYELLTGRLPFGKRDFTLSPVDAIQQIQQRIQQANLEQLVNQLPASFQPRMMQYWTIEI